MLARVGSDFRYWLCAFFFEKRAQCFLPGTGTNSECVQTGRRQYRIIRAASRSSGLVSGNGKNRNGFAAGLGKNLTREIAPGTDPLVRDVNKTPRIPRQQGTNDASKIAGVGRRADLIADHGKLRARFGRAENLFRER